MSRERTPQHENDSRRRAQELASRLGQSRQYFEQHHAQVEPDSAFAARVTLRVEDDPAASLAWAAMRLLPASVIVLVVLALVSLRPASRLESVTAQGADEDVLVWLLDDKDAAP